MNTWNDVIKDFSLNNAVDGEPISIVESAVISCSGRNNSIIIEPNVEVARLSVEFKGDGNTLIFRSGSRPFGKFIVGGGGCIDIGAKTRMNKPCWFQAFEGRSIVVGANCLFANIRVRTSDLHSVVSTVTGGRLNFARDVLISDDVWVAERAHIYKGVTIGRGAIVGAHAVVVKSIPAYSASAGNPAKVIRSNVTWRRPLLGPGGDPSAIKPTSTSTSILGEVRRVSSNLLSRFGFSR